jgi:hypothetical protein
MASKMRLAIANGRVALCGGCAIISVQMKTKQNIRSEPTKRTNTEGNNETRQFLNNQLQERNYLYEN